MDSMDKATVTVGAWHRRADGSFTGGGGQTRLTMDHVGDKDYPYMDPEVAFVHSLDRVGHVVTGDLRPDRDHCDAEVAETGHSFIGYRQTARKGQTDRVLPGWDKGW